MEEIFVTKLRINKVRHLENLEIPLSETERKHLILTGKNGSGKTSVLEALKDSLFFYRVVNGQGEMLDSILAFEKSNPLENIKNQDLKEQFDDLKESLTLMNNALKALNVEVFYGDRIKSNVKNRSKFTVTFFNAKRNVKFLTSNGVKKINFEEEYFQGKANKDFVQYLVNQRYNLIEFTLDKQIEKSKQIEGWFDAFKKSLENIFDDKKLDFQFDRENYNFNIKLSDGKEFNLMQLSDGYASILDIISELLIRAEGKKQSPYDLQGIVLIDEIETHLHIDLQKKILPFLTSFFPKIQFIVTTHSPFVLSSVDNAVIYDLEKQQVVEDLSDYSYQELVETYFGTDQYSHIVKQKLDEYEVLIKKEGRTEEEEDKLYELRKYFRKLPFFLSPELQLKIQELELYKLPEQAV